MAERKARRTGHRLLVAAGAVLAVLVVFAVAVIVLVDQGAVSNRIEGWVLPRVEQRLGRDVQVGQVKVKLFPSPRVVLEQGRIEEKEGGVPLLDVERAELKLALWPLITSLGKEIRVTRVDLYKPELNLIRDRGGTWNVQDLGEQPEKPAPSEREVVVERFTTTDGTIRIIDRTSSHGEATAALTNVDATATDIGPGLPLAMRASAAFASEEQNLQLDMSLDELPASLENLSPGNWPAIKGLLSVTDARVARLESFLPARLGEVITGGLLDLDAELSTGAEGGYLVNGNANLSALQLRGKPAEGSFRMLARVNPATPEAAKIEVNDLHLRGPGIELGGTASLEGAPARVQFALKGPLLDLDTLLGVLPERPSREDEAGAQAELLPVRVRQKLDALEASGTLHLDRIVNGKLSATNFDGRARMKNGQLTLDQAKAEFYAGEVDAGGTTVDLTAPVPNWRLRARLSGVDLQQAMANLSAAQPALDGRVNASVTLDGRGADWKQLAPTLTGRGTLAVTDGVLTTSDLGQQLAGSLAQGFRALGRNAEARTAERAAGETSLGRFATSFQVRDGWIELGAPIALNAPFGAARLDGRIGLNRELNLQGTIALSQQFVSTALKGANIRPAGPIEVPLALSGTLSEPVVTVPNPEKVATSIIRGEAEKRGRQLENEVKRQARRKIDETLRQYLP